MVSATILATSLNINSTNAYPLLAPVLELRPEINPSKIYLRSQPKLNFGFDNSSLDTTGLFIIIGTTFGGCTEPQSDLTKILFNDYMKIIIKTSYDY